MGELVWEDVQTLGSSGNSITSAHLLDAVFLASVNQIKNSKAW